MKHLVVDFRLLNIFIMHYNTTTSLLGDIFIIIGNSKCEILSCIDIKDAFCSVHLSGPSIEYCRILTYFGSPVYRYEVLPMDVTTSPARWMSVSVSFLKICLIDHNTFP